MKPDKALSALLAALLLLFGFPARSQNSMPLFNFAVFYNDLLEFTWSATLTINGPVYCNTNIFVGSASDLTFNGLVSAGYGIYKTNWNGHTLTQMTGDIEYNYNYPSGYITNVPFLNLPIGSNHSSTMLGEIIKLPPPGEDVNSPLARQRYFNKAGVIIIVSNSSVILQVKNSPSDTPITTTYNFSKTNYTGVTTNLSFLSLSNSFTDPRESKTIKLSDIDVGSYRLWLLTNSAINSKFPSTARVYNSTDAVPNILYIADFRTNGLNELKAVRLKNGTIIPTNRVMVSGNALPSGFTLATPNPLYVMGNYNLGTGGAEGSTNTSSAFPASLVSDALTILSSSWSRSNYTGNETLGVRVATNTTVNAAILTGNVPSTGATDDKFSGGAMNLPRLLEDWDASGTTLTLNTSLVNLFSSAQATNQFRPPGDYYYAPWRRQFNFDANFLTAARLPPGTPEVMLFGQGNPILGPTTLLFVLKTQQLTLYAPRLSIIGLPGNKYAIEASTNLVDWTRLATNVSPFTFTDTNAPNYPQRYYRAVSFP